MPDVRDLVAYLTIASFGFMGVVALVAPLRVTTQFDITKLSVAGRSEVRAVYGGFGLTMAAVLAAGVVDPQLRAGVFVTTAAALGGMAGGRVVSAITDRTIGGYPLLYFVIELVAGSSILWAR